jgi:hypothetical protein
MAGSVPHQEHAAHPHAHGPDRGHARVTHGGHME